jgi:hypothetical protein
MRIDTVQIYSDASNAVVMKQPGPRFPGVPVQGDPLHSLCVAADAACEASYGRIEDDAYDLNELRNRLRALLAHRRSVLAEHRIGLPVNEVSDA